ncbi:MAG: hypothetical protein AB8G22_05470 [Saprospiraceae bacterium]
MGLALQTGILSTLHNNDLDQFLLYQKEIKAAASYLQRKGVTHQFTEPTDLSTDRQWTTDMYGYSGLHYLRRLAAHVNSHKSLPSPGDWQASSDPVLIQYFENYFSGDTSTLLKQVLTRKRVFPFEHLIIHSDTDGFYLPIDFQRVIVTENSDLSGGFIGSSYRLLEELRELAKWLELDLNREITDIDLYDAAESQGEGTEKWARYGVESFTCLKLYHGCLESVENRCALVFR